MGREIYCIINDMAEVLNVSQILYENALGHLNSNFPNYGCRPVFVDWFEWWHT